MLIPKTGSIAETAPIRLIRRTLEFLTVGMVAVYAILIVIQVFFRYALNSSLTWSEEVVQFLLLWSVLVGSAVATDRGAHIVLNPIDAHLSPRWRRIRSIAADLCTIGFCAVLLYQGAILVMRTQIMTSSAAQIPMYYVYSAMPIGAGLIILFAAVHAIAGTVRESHEADELT